MQKTPKHARSKPASQRGMALIEVLVSILLFSLGILGLIGLQANAIRYSNESQFRNRASLVANEIAAAMWLNNSATLDTSAGTPSWDDKVKAELPDGTVAVVAVDPSVMPNSADISITWKPPQRQVGESEISQLTTRVTLPPT